MTTEEATQVPAKKFPVVEMFGPTIEGEGSIIGMQTMFIRFGLCDYKCKRCDSMHAVNPQFVKILAQWQTAEEIMAAFIELQEKTNSTHIKNVVFSGGNPAIHDLTELNELMQHYGMRVHVETQGTKMPDWMQYVHHIVVSPKSPGMGEKFEPEVFKRFMTKYLCSNVSMNIKIVVFSAQDLEFASAVAELCQDLARETTRYDLMDNFYLSLGNDKPPVFGLIPDPQDGKASVGQEDLDKKALVGNLLNSYNILSEEIMKDPRLHFAKFLPQLHVLVWGNETGR